MPSIDFTQFLVRTKVSLDFRKTWTIATRSVVPMSTDELLKSIGVIFGFKAGRRILPNVAPDIGRQLFPGRLAKSSRTAKVDACRSCTQPERDGPDAADRGVRCLPMVTSRLRR
jgi:hypothetical protein